MIQVGYKTDKGKMRGNNEDSLFVMDTENIYIVADGVGGHNSGQLASRTAVEKISEYTLLNSIQEVKNEADLKNYFLQCLREVNRIIYSLANTSVENSGMATTVVILYLLSNKAYIANVGDSRAYVIRNGQISQITEDHTYVNELLKEGSITKAQAETHPHKNMITRALGGEETILPDFFQLVTEKDDILILCSDGLYGEVTQEEICFHAEKEISMNDLCSNLVDLANGKGGSDNITVICIKI